MVSWGDLKPVLVPIMVTIVVTTVLVMGVSGRTAQFVLKKEEKKDEEYAAWIDLFLYGDQSFWI